MSEKVGRPKKEDIPFDEEVVKKFIERMFSIEKEIKTLREDKKELRDEFKNEVDMKLVNNIIKIVKAELALSCSDDTRENLSGLIKDKINMVVG